ncbi:MAG: hypothetical protein KBF82_03800 [Chitinophagaceae bacterium]|nr:hypothetical protein [Chitinophagaceae bacterium]MBP9102966.1 hypothetical protein [Chitinophagaceae bacterium]
MKKIFLSALVLLLIMAANAQNSRSTTDVKASSDPLVNGIPYSQYKAQQEVLKQAEIKNAFETKAATTQSTAVQGSAYDKPTDTQLKNMQPKPVTTTIIAPAKAPVVTIVKDGEAPAATKIVAPASDVKEVIIGNAKPIKEKPVAPPVKKDN